jgi:8-amino-7-oxononanoate synthase
VETLDFSSALYLGLRHPAPLLPAWGALTLGKPAALREPPGAAALCAELARLQGCATTTLLPSTLHLFWDVFAMLAGEPLVVLADGGAYPVARRCAEKSGLPMEGFMHADSGAAAMLARRWTSAGRRPLILADGYTPGKSKAPPLSDYAGIAARGGGMLLIDDTQALGLLGHGGGGSLWRLRREWRAPCAAPVLVGASLAKAFGAPLAVLGGSAAMIARFRAGSRARLHSSPPSAAAIAAARRALRINRRCGACLRACLWTRVRQWRQRMAAGGLRCLGGHFPVQSVVLADGTGIDAAARVHACLRRDGIEALLQGTGAGPVLTFLLRADHRAADVDRAAGALQRHLLELT